MDQERKGQASNLEICVNEWRDSADDTDPVVWTRDALSKEEFAAIAANPEVYIRRNDSCIASANAEHVAKQLKSIHDWTQGWLRFGLRSDSWSENQWSVLNQLGADRSRIDDPYRSLHDRDEWTFTRWQLACAVPDSSNNVCRSGCGANVYRTYVEDEIATWPTHEARIFSAFLARFDLPHARRVYEPHSVYEWPSRIFATVLLAIPTVTAYVSWHDVRRPQSDEASWWWALVVLSIGGAAALFLKPAVAPSAPWGAYAHVLVPRLAAMVGIGFLFQASASSIVGFYVTAMSGRAQGIASCALLLFALVFTWGHIDRRVRPPLARGTLLRRAGGILGLAVAYAALELTLFAPMLFNRRLFDADNRLYDKLDAIWTSSTVPPALILSAAIALALGVVLQQVWEEKPLSEPL